MSDKKNIKVKNIVVKCGAVITSTDGESTFTTVGVSNDVVEASFQALQDSIEYLLLKTGALHCAAEG